MQITTVRADSENTDFRELVGHLDAELAIKNGEDDAFYAQYNKIDKIQHVVVAYADGVAAGCGAIKKYDDKAMEVKRMYTLPNYRGKGVASAVLAELERWAAEQSFEKCILETGVILPEAIALYTKSNYRAIENYGQYIGNEDSRCFEKQLTITSA